MTEDMVAPTKLRRPARWRRRTVSIAPQLPAFVVLAAVWELLARAVGSAYVPPLSTIVRRMAHDWLGGAASHLFFSDLFVQNFLPTVGRLALGWVVAVLAGIALGVLLGRVGALRALADPLVRLAMALPPPALLPLAIVLFGLGAGMKVFLIAFGCVWPVLVNSIDGVRSIDATFLATARTLHLSPARRLVQVVLPAASPQIFAGLRTSLGTAIILVVVAELYASSSGIGYVIVREQRSFDILGTWSGVLLLGALGIVATWLFGLIERRVMRWHVGARKAAE